MHIITIIKIVFVPNIMHLLKIFDISLIVNHYEVNLYRTIYTTVNVPYCTINKKKMHLSSIATHDHREPAITTSSLG